METITSFILAFPQPLLIFLVFLPLSFALLLLFFFFFTNKRSRSPPGSTGLPFIGDNVELGLLGPRRFVSKRMKKYSPDVFVSSLVGENIATLCGPQGNKFLFSNDNKLFTFWYPKSVEKVLFFTETGDDSKKVKHVMLSFLHDTLKPDALKTSVSVVDPMTKHHIDTYWAPYGEVKVLPSLRKYTLSLACKIFMGIEDPNTVLRLMKHFDVVTNGMFSVPIDFPGTAYNLVIKAGKLFRQELRTIIKMQRKELMENKEVVRPDNILTRMLLHANEEGRFMNEMEISDIFVPLLVATNETTSTVLTFVLKHLADYPHIYGEVLKEQMDILKSKCPGELLRWDDIEKMKYTWKFVCESMRMVPAGLGGTREALTDFEFAGFTIPKGMKIFWNVFTTYNNPKYFPNPDKFDPSRFEGRGPAPYTYVPFGGGPSMCPGRELARVVVLIFIHNFVINFKLEKSIPDEKIVYRSNPVPVKGLPVRLYRHKEHE